MFPNRIRLPSELTDILKQLKGKTGMTPNILCRIAIINSVKNGPRPDATPTDLLGLEFNTPTLFGQHAVLYYTVFNQLYGRTDSNRLEELVAFHISDGVAGIRTARSVAELVDICQKTPITAPTYEAKDTPHSYG